VNWVQKVITSMFFGFGFFLSLNFFLWVGLGSFLAFFNDDSSVVCVDFDVISDLPV